MGIYQNAEKNFWNSHGLYRLMELIGSYAKLPFGNCVTARNMNQMGLLEDLETHRKGGGKGEDGSFSQSKY